MTGILLAPIILLSGAALCLVVSGNRRRSWISLLTQLLAAILVLGAVTPILFGAPEVTGELFWSFPVERIGIRVDAVSAFFLTFSLPMTLLGTLYARGYLAPYFEKKRHGGYHFGILNLIALSFILIYTVENAMAFLLGWEIAALAAWLAVIWDYRNQRVRFAGFNYLVSTHLSFLFLLAGFMIMHSAARTFDFQGFRGFLGERSTLRNITFLLLMSSFGLKSAYFPFHTWLPRAHSAAPAHVSALMSGVIHKAGIYGILRFTTLLGKPEPWMAWYLIGFSVTSAFMGVIYTASQRDLKRLLGYSSTENVGIAGIGIGVGYLGLCWNNPAMVAAGFAGAILHVLNHALFKCLLFYAAGAVYRMTHTVDLEKLGGLWKKMPMTAGYFLLGGLAISAIPPLNGFVSEFLIYRGLLDPGVPGIAAQAILVVCAAGLAFVGAVSLLAMTRAYGVTFLGSPRDQATQCHGEAPRSMLLPMGLHAAGIVLLGLVPAAGFHLVARPAGVFLGLLGSGVTAGDALPRTLQLLQPLAWMGMLLVAIFAASLGIRRQFLSAAVKRQVTWGCGYSRVNTRMQYTGSSFSQQFLSLFLPLLGHSKRERLPEAVFPGPDHHLHTHHGDAVEQRMFKVLGEGESLMIRTKRRLSEDATLGFSAGLICLMILMGYLVTRP